MCVVYTQSSYRPLLITYVEPLPASVPLRQDLGAVNAGATVTQTLITGIQLNEKMLLQCRIKPIDDVDLILWLQRGVAKFWIRNTHARVNLGTGLLDPSWKSTTFWVIAKDKDLYVEARNLSDYNLNQCRLQIWGWRASYRYLDDGAADSRWVVDGERRVLKTPQGAIVFESPYNRRAIQWIAAEGRAG